MDCLPHFHVAAIHAEAGYRAVTPGIGILCRHDNYMAGAGVFSNSMGKASKYAIAGWQPLQIGPVRVGAIAGLIDGYPYRSGGAFPFGGGAFSIPWKHGELHLTVIPKVQNISPATVGLSFTWRIQ